MSSELFDLENYLQHGGFLNKKFWITNIFHGSSDNIQTNLYDVNLKLKTKYNSLDLLPAIKQA